VSVDESASEGEDPGAEEDELAWRPYGARPYGARPYGARPYEPQPYGARPYGAKPYGARPYGARPYGARPYGARPYGARPYGARPGSAREGDRLDPEEWSVDLANLVCEYSAIVRLGATLVTGGYELKVPSRDGETPLRPREDPVTEEAVLPNRIVRDIAADSGLAYGVKTDLAAGLASEADGRFLTKLQELDPVEDDDPLVLAREVVTAVRTADSAPTFLNPGWVLGLESLDRLSRLKTADCLIESHDPGARSLDSFQLLRLDGSDGGAFLGYPFVISRAAEAAIYFAADWREAWIGFDAPLVRADASSEAAFHDDETVVRAVMSYDFALRRPQGFKWAQLPEVPTSEDEPPSE
jgi:hypothetical protein